MIEQVTTREEMAALLPMARAFSERAGETLSEERWVEKWTERLAFDDTAVVFYQTNGGPEPVGMIAGACYENQISGELEAKEAFWFVEPEHRGHGMDLLERFESWASEHKAKRVWMVRLDGLRERALDRIYERRGYRPVERSFCMEMTNGS